jgi:hypothetical protein
MNNWPTRLLVATVLSVAGHVASAAAQLPPLKAEPAADQLACGQKVLVENQTCPRGQILEVTGSCLFEKEVPGTIRRGRQFNCVERKK